MFKNDYLPLDFLKKIKEAEEKSKKFDDEFDKFRKKTEESMNRRNKTFDND